MPTIKDKVTGDVVSRQPYTAEGTQRAEQIAESDQNWEIDHVPTQDGAARNVTEYAGGGNTGYAQIGQEYKEGGRTSNPYSKNIPGGLEKQRARRERIAKANEDAAKRSKKKRDDRRQARKDRRAARRDKKQGVVKKVETKGGDYPVYKKESKKAESFRSKFARKRKAGAKTFNWKGRSYTTETAEDVVKKKAKTKPAKGLGVKSPDYIKPTPKPKKFTKTKKVSPALGPVNKPERKKKSKKNIIGPIVERLSKRKKK